MGEVTEGGQQYEKMTAQAQLRGRKAVDINKTDVKCLFFLFLFLIALRSLLSGNNERLAGGTEGSQMHESKF